MLYIYCICLYILMYIYIDIRVYRTIEYIIGIRLQYIIGIYSPVSDPWFDLD